MSGDCTDEVTWSMGEVEEATDREIDAYHVGWKWPVGKADREDWSRCGKQWTDASVCAAAGKP